MIDLLLQGIESRETGEPRGEPADRVIERIGEYIATMEDGFEGHPVQEGRTLVLPSARIVWDDGPLPLVLAEHGIEPESIGWRREGLAVVFRSQLDAAKFRLLWPDETMVPHL